MMTIMATRATYEKLDSNEARVWSILLFFMAFTMAFLMALVTIFRMMKITRAARIRTPYRIVHFCNIGNTSPVKLNIGFFYFPVSPVKLWRIGQLLKTCCLFRVFLPVLRSILH